MWFREGREALEASSYCEYSREDVGAWKRTAAYLPNLSKTAHFSAPIEGEKWPPFPRLKSRGPIEAEKADSKVKCFDSNKKKKAGESDERERPVDELSGSNRCCGDHASG